MKLQRSDSSTTTSLQEALAEFVIDRASYQLKPASLRFYKTHTGGLIAFLEEQSTEDLASLDRRAIRRFFAHLNQRTERGEITQATVAAYDRATRTFCRFCELEGWIDDPMRGRRRIKAPRKLPDTWLLDEANRILSTCDDSLAGRRDRAIITLMLDTGVRAGELVHLPTDHVTWNGDQGQLLIRAEWSKSPHDRIIPVWYGTMAALQSWIETRPQEARTLFVAFAGQATLTHKPLTVNGLNQMMHRRVTAAGVPPKSKMSHIWRHTFAARYVLAGGDIGTLQRMMGHASITTTEIYLGFRDCEVSERHALFSPMKQLSESMTR